MTTQIAFRIDISNAIPAPAVHEAVAVCIFSDAPHAPGAARIDASLEETCLRLVRDGEFDGEQATSLLIHQPGHTGARRLLLVGVGAHADFDPATTPGRAASIAVRRAREARIECLHFVAPAADDVGSAGGSDHDANAQSIVRRIAEGAHLGLYDGDFYQQREPDDPPPLARFNIIVPEVNDALRGHVEHARIIAEAVNWARTLADEPGASLPPREFARRAAEMAAAYGLGVESLDAAEIRARGMGGLWGVGQGSDEEPALIVIRYEPETRGADDEELWAFVGKGITFDTGGLSLKPSPGMEEMKSDMAGGAAVLGALRAIAQLKPAQRIVGIIPTAENMPSGRAIKPGDIVRTLAGMTIEVVDTDAEGRLVLVDGIAYARQLGAARIVDLATLTGSIIVALGDHLTGLFSNDDAWAEDVRAAATRAGEPVWRMPVSDDYKKLIESPIADFKNYGGRPDATGAALLLSRFAGTTPWAHLDIAGTSWNEDPHPHAPKGSTGTGVRTLVELACGSRITTNGHQDA